MKALLRSKKGKIILCLAAIVISAIILFAMPRNGGNVIYGVTFSKDFAIHLGLDWKETYLALLDDMDVKNLRIPSYWTEIEPQKNNYTFENLDWQISEAGSRNAAIILTLGQKQPRWPECHIPDWAKNSSKEEREKELLEIIGKTVERYKGNRTVARWQVENEPFLPFGECPKFDEAFLDKEIGLVRSLDGFRPIIISDSGELGTWYSAGRRADILGTTLYRIVWDKNLGYIKYPISSLVYRIKAAIIMLIAGVQKIIIVELQTEPWGPKMIIETPIEEQYRSMGVEQFKNNIEYVKKVEFSEAYLWGAEWWYWLKTKQNDSRIWNEAKKVF
ncbi:MAG: beta-galactosidase [Minisyncoccia bacterium]